MGKFFIFLNNFLLRRKAALIILLVLLVGLISYSLFHLKTDEDFASIFPEDKNTEQYNFAIKNSSFSNRIIIYFSTSDTASPNKTDTLIRYADLFVDKIKSEFKDQIKTVKYEVTDEEIFSLYDFFYENLPLFLNDEDYNKIAKKISDSSIRSILANNYKALVSPAGIALKQFLVKDPLSLTPLAIEKLNLFQTGDNFTLDKNRIFSKDKNDLFVFLTVANSSNTGAINSFITGIDKFGREIENPEISINSFGSPIISAANANRIKDDIKVTISITLIFFFVLLSLYFRNSFIPFFLFVPVVFGGGIALMVLYFLKGEVSAISLGIGSILLGIGIDYSLHFITHYKHSLSLQNLFKDISVPIMVSSITTASAFLCLYVIKSPGLQDLGLFAAISILSAALATLIILPLILIPIFKPKTKRTSFSLPDNIASYRFEKNKVLVIAIIVLSFVFYYTGKQTSFNENLMDMNYMTDELRAAEKKINQNTSFAMSSVFVVSSGKDLEEALTNNALIIDSLENLKESGVVQEYYNVNELILTKRQQKEKIKKWNLFWESKTDQLISNLEKYGEDFGYKPIAFKSFDELLNRSFEPIVIESFDDIIDLYLQDYLIRQDEKSAVITMIKANRSEKNQVRAIVAEKDDSYFLDRQAFAENLFSLIKSQFRILILLSMAIVFLILLLSFGRIELAIISFVPIVLSWIWTIGIMGIFNYNSIFSISLSQHLFLD